MLGKHKFQARYDFVAPEWFNRLSELTKIRGSLRDHAYEKVYVRDVCTRCGEVIDRC